MVNGLQAAPCASRIALRPVAGYFRLVGLTGPGGRRCVTHVVRIRGRFANSRRRQKPGAQVHDLRHNFSTLSAVLRSRRGRVWARPVPRSIAQGRREPLLCRCSRPGAELPFAPLASASSWAPARPPKPWISALAACIAAAAGAISLARQLVNAAKAAADRY